MLSMETKELLLLLLVMLAGIQPSPARPVKHSDSINEHKESEPKTGFLDRLNLWGKSRLNRTVSRRNLASQDLAIKLAAIVFLVFFSMYILFIAVAILYHRLVKINEEYEVTDGGEAVVHGTDSSKEMVETSCFRFIAVLGHYFTKLKLKCQPGTRSTEAVAKGRDNHEQDNTQIEKKATSENNKAKKINNLVKKKTKVKEKHKETTAVMKNKPKTKRKK